MAEAIFDKDGTLTNADQLSPQEIAGAYHEKNKVSHGRMLEEKTKREEAEAREAKLKADLEEAKKTPPEPVKPPDKPAKPDGISPEELRLIAQGLSDEEIDEAKSIATGKGITLPEALKTRSFKLFQEDLKEEKRKEAAKLGANGGSPSSLPPTGIKPNMTTAEHLEAWKKAQGK